MQRRETNLASIYCWIVRRGRYLEQQKVIVAAGTLASETATMTKAEQRKNAEHSEDTRDD